MLAWIRNPLPGVAAAVLLSACYEVPDKPPAPDMSGLIEAYATPTAALDQSVADEIAVTIQAELRITAAIDSFEDLLGEVIEPAVDDEGETAQIVEPGEPAGVRVDGDGFFRIEHVCRGWDAAATEPDRAANGQLDFTIGFGDAGLDPIAWGDFGDCKQLISEREVFVSGAIRLYLGDALQFDGLGEEPILFQLLARLEVDGEEMVDEEFDFQYCPRGATGCAGGQVTLAIDTAADERLFFYLDTGASEAGLRAANGDWPCEIDLDSASATCTSEESGDTVTLVDFMPESAP